MNLKTKVSLKTERHPYHLVNASAWPFLVSITAFTVVTTAVCQFTSYSPIYKVTLPLNMIIFLFIIGNWWKNVIEESTFEGFHTLHVQKGLAMGMFLFIVSEVMFFFSFFWAFFYFSLSPPPLANVWPPLFIIPLNPWGVPLLNTIILLSSGVTVTLAHKAILQTKNWEYTIIALILTILLGLIFTVFQVLEYIEAQFFISDGVYGSIFFMATGFHGFHVLIGTLFLIVCTYRTYVNHFTPNHHNGFIFCIWYWHFVDVVWLFLFVTIYWWGN